MHIVVVCSVVLEEHTFHRGVMHRRRRSPDDVATRHPHAEIENDDDDEDEDENYQGQYFYQPQQHWQQQQQERREQQSTMDQQQQQQQQPFYHDGSHGHYQQQHPVHPYQHDTRAFVHSEAYSEQLTEPLLQPSTSKRSHTHRPVGGASPTGSNSSGSGSSKKDGTRRKESPVITTGDEKHEILDDKSVATVVAERSFD